MSVLGAHRVTYSPHTRVQVAERLLIAGLRAQERADESDAERGRLSFLFKASQRLAQSLEPITVLQTLLDVIVPEIADEATLRIIPPGSRSAQSTSATSSALAERTEAWWHWIDRATRPSMTRAIRLGKPVYGVASPRGSRVVSIATSQVSYIAVPLRTRERSIGALRLLSVEPRRMYRLDDAGLAEACASQASLALENAWLYQEQRTLVAHLEDIHGQLDAAHTEWLRDDERRRIARDLHDHVEQAFFAIGLAAKAALDSRRGEPRGADLAEALQMVGQLAVSGSEQLRGAIFALKHAEYSAFGLVSTLRTLVRSFEQRTGVDADLVVSGSESNLTTEVSETLHAVAREALTNVERHAHASSALVRLQMRPSSVTLSVHDDGSGASSLALKRIRGTAMHFGLAGLRERVRRFNGSFSARPGTSGGFVVRAHLPLPSGTAA